MKLTRKLALLAAPALLSWALLGNPLRAQETPSTPPAAPAAPTSEAPAAPPATEAPKAGATATPPTDSKKAPEAAPEAAPKEKLSVEQSSVLPDSKEPPKPTLEQRVAGLEAYLNNSDPTASLKTGPKDKDGNATVPDGLTTPSVGTSGPGHNAWMMTSTALVLFMTLPGLALFYGGLVRKKNVLSVCAQCLGCAGMVTILWWAFGYSLVFGENFDNGILGGSEFFFFKGVTSAPNPHYAPWISQNVFACYQLMFAIITPALIVGAIAERMKFMAIMVFIALWMFFVYFPMAHMIWGYTGLMSGNLNPHAGIKAIDFAGGTVVHMTSGWSALLLCIILGKRLGFGKEKMAPHNMVLCMVGTGMLWVGWYGFNAGSALGADAVAATAFTATTLAAASAGFFWALIELFHKGHASILGFCSGIVAGLVVITPACGFVSPAGAMLIGLLAAVVPYIFVVFVKGMIRYDDALDTFGVHAVGGTLGAILTGVLAVQTKFADGKPNPDLVNGNLPAAIDSLINSHTLILEQLKAIAITLAISVAGTIILGYIVKIVLGGLRPSPEGETTGLDLTDHQEEGYII